MAPVHTFVVPAYGRSPFLRDCLQSLRAQTVASRLVVATSTPFDGIEALAAEYGATLAVHSPNAGIGKDWNFALAQAKTAWVTLAHQDDVYLPQFAARSLARAQRDLRTALVVTGYREMAAGDPRPPSPMLAVKRLLLELGFLGRGKVAGGTAKRRMLRFGCPIPCPAVTLNVAALRGFSFREDLRVNLDWDAWMRLASLPGAFALVREPLMLHRIHAVSETSAAVRGGVRATEDRMMFEASWPRPIARLLARAYTLSYESGADA